MNFSTPVDRPHGIRAACVQRKLANRSVSNGNRTLFFFQSGRDGALVYLDSFYGHNLTAFKNDQSG